jgi:O-antigen/teichoic acid export membrane protein
VSETITATLAPVKRFISCLMFCAEAFGFFALFTSISSILIIIACLRYELSIVLPESDEMAVNLLALCFLINFIFSISLFLIIGLFGKEIDVLTIRLFSRYRPAGI